VLPPHLDAYTISVYRYVMIQSFADRSTADLWAQLNTKAARRIPRALWPTVHRKLTMLDSAQRLEDLAVAPGNRLETLAGDRKGQHRIRLNQQYRIMFRWEHKDAQDVCCEDDHE
jgi:proteic killer suppression protein